MNEKLPSNLSDVLYVELQKMQSRNLDFAPQPEDLPATHAVILEDLKRYGLTDEDTDRLRRAFWHLGPMIQRFPTPAMIIRALPSKREQLGKPAYGIVNREGQRKFIDEARAALGFDPGEEGDK